MKKRMREPPNSGREKYPCVTSPAHLHSALLSPQHHIIEGHPFTRTHNPNMRPSPRLRVINPTYLAQTTHTCKHLRVPDSIFVLPAANAPSSQLAKCKAESCTLVPTMAASSTCSSHLESLEEPLKQNRPPRFKQCIPSICPFRSCGRKYGKNSNGIDMSINYR